MRTIIAIAAFCGGALAWGLLRKRAWQWVAYLFTRVEY